MPIYEYECLRCGQVTGFWVKRPQPPEAPVCEFCGTKEVKRVISRVNFHLPQSDRLASYSPGAERDPSFYRDSRNIGLRAEKMLKDAGVEPPESFKAKLDNLRSDPSRVLKE